MFTIELYSSDFEELHAKDNTFTVHKRNLRSLAIKIYKTLNNLSPIFTRVLMTQICVPYNTTSTTKVEGR